MSDTKPPLEDVQGSESMVDSRSNEASPVETRENTEEPPQEKKASSLFDTCRERMSSLSIPVTMPLVLSVASALTFFAVLHAIYYHQEEGSASSPSTEISFLTKRLNTLEKQNQDLVALTKHLQAQTSISLKEIQEKIEKTMLSPHSDLSLEAIRQQLKPEIQSMLQSMVREKLQTDLNAAILKASKESQVTLEETLSTVQTRVESLENTQQSVTAMSMLETLRTRLESGQPYLTFLTLFVHQLPTSLRTTTLLGPLVQKATQGVPTLPTLQKELLVAANSLHEDIKGKSTLPPNSPENREEKGRIAITFSAIFSFMQEKIRNLIRVEKIDTGRKEEALTLSVSLPPSLPAALEPVYLAVAHQNLTKAIALMEEHIQELPHQDERKQRYAEWLLLAKDRVKTLEALSALEKRLHQLLYQESVLSDSESASELTPDPNTPDSQGELS